MRYLALAVAMISVGGYVFAQEPILTPPRGNLPPLGAAQMATPDEVLAVDEVVCRYVPAGEGLMLDTITGTLYERQQGSWQACATLEVKTSVQSGKLRRRLMSEIEVAYARKERALASLAAEPHDELLKQQAIGQRLVIDVLSQVLNQVP